jgi:hypothetical protein
MSNRANFNRLPTLVAVALVGGIAGCDRGEPPVAPSPPHTGSFSVTTTCPAWSNEPTGFAALNDYGFSDPLPTGQSQPIGSSGWFINNPDDAPPPATGSAVLASDGTAPCSAPGVMQVNYPTGFVGGHAPAKALYAVSPVKETYWGLWWKPSNPWQNHAASGFNDIAIIFTETGGNIVIELDATTGQYQLHVVPFFPNDNTRNLAPNRTATVVTLGAWHKVEWYVKYATTGTSRDGVVRWWLDGVLQGEYIDLQTPADLGFGEYQIAPIWGGTGGSKSETDAYWYDHSHISARTGCPAWSNEPTGFTLINNYDFRDPLPTGTSQPIGTSGWSINNPTNPAEPQGTGAVLASDNAAPCSPPGVMQMTYPVNFFGGYGPAKAYFERSGITESYWGFWWKPSNPWQNHVGSAINKIAFMYTPTNGSNIYIAMHWTGTQYELDVTPFFVGGDNGTRVLTPNQTLTPVTLGAWHKIEWYVKYAATPGGPSGIVRWWLDGVLQGQYTDVRTSPDAGFNAYAFDPTWGGGGGTKSETDFYWYDHSHISKGP